MRIHVFTLIAAMLVLSGCYQSNRGLMPQNQKEALFGDAFTTNLKGMGEGVWRRVGSSYQNSKGEILSIDKVSGKNYIVQFKTKSSYIYLHAWRKGRDHFSIANGSPNNLKSEMQKLRLATDAVSINPLIWKQWLALKGQVNFDKGVAANFYSYDALTEIAANRPAVSNGYFWVDSRDVFIDRL